jgi:hypothetical protein
MPLPTSKFWKRWTITEPLQKFCDVTILVSNQVMVKCIQYVNQTGCLEDIIFIDVKNGRNWYAFTC